MLQRQQDALQQAVAEASTFLLANLVTLTIAKLSAHPNFATDAATTASTVAALMLVFAPAASGTAASGTAASAPSFWHRMLAVSQHDDHAVTGQDAAAPIPTQFRRLGAAVLSRALHVLHRLLCIDHTILHATAGTTDATAGTTDAAAGMTNDAAGMTDAALVQQQAAPVCAAGDAGVSELLEKALESLEKCVAPVQALCSDLVSFLASGGPAGLRGAAERDAVLFRSEAAALHGCCIAVLARCASSLLGSLGAPDCNCAQRITAACASPSVLRLRAFQHIACL